MVLVTMLVLTYESMQMIEHLNVATRPYAEFNV
jgi:hypothetical protein